MPEVCAGCGYPREGLPPETLCPECGLSTLDAAATRDARLARRNRELVIVACVLCCFILIAELPVVPFAPWNWLPVVSALLLARLALERSRGLWSHVPTRRRGGVIGFTVLGVGSSVLSHLLWLIEGGAVGGSSTAGLMFLFVPVYAMALGIVGGIAGTFAGALVGRLTSRLAS